MVTNRAKDEQSEGAGARYWGRPDGRGHQLPDCAGDNSHLSNECACKKTRSTAPRACSSRRH
eukprot:5436174-Pleurochrysis_carterae.AAC.1